MSLHASWIKMKPQNVGSDSAPSPTYIHGHAVEVIESFTYLGSDTDFSGRLINTGNTQMYWFSCEHNWAGSLTSDDNSD